MKWAQGRPEGATVAPCPGAGSSAVVQGSVASRLPDVSPSADVCLGISVEGADARVPMECCAVLAPTDRWLGMAHERCPRGSWTPRRRTLEDKELGGLEALGSQVYGRR